jgi:hypothetical protein
MKIGEMSDILPSKNSFRFNKKVVGLKGPPRDPVELGNVTTKVRNAILSVLDMYFACKCNEYTKKQIENLDNMGSRMIAHIKVLWNLKQAIMYEVPREILMRKIHAPDHIPKHINQFGPMLYADTATYESSHKHYTTGVWRGTSKRHGTLVKEMTTASVIQSCAGHLNFYTTLKQMDGVSNCQQKFGPKPGSDDFTINPFTNVCDIRFIITSDKDSKGNNILVGCGPNDYLFNEGKFFGHSSLPNQTHISQYLRKRYNNKTWNAMTKQDTMYEFSIVRAASYEGSKDSGVGKGVLYAMSKNSGTFKRYDYVTVKVDIDDVWVDQVAQVLMILQAHKYEINDKNNRVLKTSVWYLIVQYMNKGPKLTYTNKRDPTRHEQLSNLIWEQMDKQNMIPANKSSFSIALIPISCLVGSSIVIPWASTISNNKGTKKKNDTPTMGKPAITDMFWCLGRKFFDRSGWEELVTNDDDDNNNNNNNDINRDNMQTFINNNFIQPAQLHNADFPELYAEEQGDIVDQGEDWE